jgi:hypothetical protein
VAGEIVYKVSGGFAIWQHEFGQNEVGLVNETAVYSSFTTSNIDWITGSPGKTPNPLTPAGSQLVGMNRRMHLRRVEPNFLQTGSMSMTILGRKFANGPATDATTSGPYQFYPDTDKIDLRVEDRLVQLKFESNIINGNYEMGRLMITAELGDERP